jgi:hypothetical protein
MDAIHADANAQANQANARIAALLSVVAELASCGAELREADALARATETSEASEAPDRAATVTLLRCAAHTTRALEHLICRVEHCADFAETNAETDAETDAVKQAVTSALAHANHVCVALATASALRQAGSNAISLATSEVRLCNAICAGDTGEIALGLVLLNLNSAGEDACTLLLRRVLQRAFFLANVHADTAAYALTFSNMAAAAGHPSVLEALLETAVMLPVLLHPPPPETGTGIPLLCAFLACPEVARTAGDFVTAIGNTPLMKAVRICRVEIVRALLSCKQIVRTAGVQDARGRTALMLASHRTDTSAIISALLACEEVVATADAADESKCTALMHACPLTENVVALLHCDKVAATAGAVDLNGNTVLMIAAKYHHFSSSACTCMRALLSCARVVATVGMTDNDGATALTLAERNRPWGFQYETFVELVELLQSAMQSAASR